MSDTMLALVKLTDDAELLRERIEKGEALLKDLKAQLRILVEEQIPGAMMEAGFNECTLVNGTALALESHIHPSIPKERKEEAHRWLQDVAKLGALFKRTITVTIPKGKETDVLAEQVRERCLSVVGEEHIAATTDIHHSTLKSALRKLMEDGKSVPEDLFGIYTRSVAVITPAKE